MKTAIHKPSSNDRLGGRKKTNFDAYLEEQMKAPAFARRFRQASAAADLYGNTARLYGKSEHMNTLAQLVCSRVRAEISRILFGLGPDELHLREIQRQTGFAIGTVRQDIGKLVKMGLVTRRQDGNRVCYAANRRHPLHAELRQLVLKTVGLTGRTREPHGKLVPGSYGRSPGGSLIISIPSRDLWTCECHPEIGSKRLSPTGRGSIASESTTGIASASVGLRTVPRR